MRATSSATIDTGSTLLVAGVVAVLVGLPVAVDLNTSFDTLYSPPGLARATGGVVLGDALEVTALPGLVIENAYLSSLDRQPLGSASRRLLLEGARLRYEIAGAASAPTSPPAVTPEERGAASQRQAASALIARIDRLDLDQLVLRHAELEIRSGQRSWLLTDVAAELGPPRTRGRSLNVIATYAGQRVRLTIDWRSDAGGRPGAAVALRAKLESRFAEARFDGHLQARPDGGPSLVGEASVEARKLRALGRWLGLAIDTGPDLQDARVVGKVEWTDGVLAFDRATVRLDGNEASGALAFKSTGVRPSIVGTLGFDKLDVTRYVASLTGGKGASPSVSLPGARPMLTQVDADLRISASKVVAPELETGRGAVTLALKQGRLQADLAELEVEGGRATGQITIDVGADDMHRLGIKGRASDVDPGRIFAPLLKRNPLLGRANFSVDLAGTGTALPAILSSLSGKGSFTLADGGRLALDLRTLVHAAQSTQIVGWSAAGKGTTSLDQLEGRFAISNRSLSLESIVARSGSTSWQGVGKVDLTERLLDVIVTIAPAAGATPQPMREALAIRGTWFDPAISLLRQPAAPAAHTGEQRTAPAARLRE